MFLYAKSVSENRDGHLIAGRLIQNTRGCKVGEEQTTSRSFWRVGCGLLVLCAGQLAANFGPEFDGEISYRLVGQAYADARKCKTRSAIFIWVVEVGQSRGGEFAKDVGPVELRFA